MKKFVAALLIVGMASPAMAGKMKEIWAMTNESILATLGFDEDMVRISGYNFVKVEGVPLAVQTTVKARYRIDGIVPEFDCLTTFKGSIGKYRVRDTVCDQVQ